ncbi:Uu.00g016180.m01.CDS01 [Anthostomella pinea]|uniref:Uu.00g016180.m01.CDS01 n=1 Tax=Anthostomella pinea TaxID=933095 RepID=A0AAI8VZB3_9PEZI|nr:Uu.00g016180.m01.CDS01 [Anthostomella pinea]
MATSNYITKVTIVGAGGNSGRFMTAALLKTGKHTVTALTRPDSQSELPECVIVKRVDYGNPETLVDALRGQDALVITLSGYTPAETQMQLISAAGEAGVGWILPNEWSPDTANEALVRDVSVFKPKGETRRAITDLGKSSYIGISTGFWYEWSLAIPAAFGIDFAKRTATFFDEGETRISISTWPQVGRAVAALLSLPIAPPGDSEGTSSSNAACLENFRNQLVYVKSFTVTQREMLASAMRVTGTKESDWTITKEPAQERYTTSLSEIKEGKRVGFAKMMYTRVFFADGVGDFEDGRDTMNGVLGLPEEDLDEATERAFERSKGPSWV